MARLVPLLVCLAVRTASADGYYFTEGVGGANVRGELRAYIPAATRIRIALGMREGPWALEAWMSGLINSACVATEPGPASSPEPLSMGGFDVKHFNPLSKHLEVYLRGSMSVATGDGQLAGWGGRGLGFGAGIQLKGKVSPWGLLWTPLFFLVKTGPKITGALWLDSGYDFYRLHGPRPTAIDGQLSHITFGFALGSDL